MYMPTQLSHLSIKWKITLLTGLCLLAVVTLLIATSQYQSSRGRLVGQASTSMLEEGAKLRLLARADLHAIRNQRYFLDAYQYGKGFSRQVLFLREQAEKRLVEAFNLREDLTYQAHSNLMANADLLGLSIIFEPDALDRSDAQFVGRGALGTNDAGRFALYWRQLKPGDLRAEVLSDPQLSDASDHPYAGSYRCALQQGRECLSEPYWLNLGDSTLLVTTITFPLQEKGKVIGVMGVDIGLDRLHQVALQASDELYPGQSQVSIVSSSGLLVGHSRNDSDLDLPPVLVPLPI